MQLLAGLSSTRYVSSTRLPVCAFGLWLFFCGFIGVLSLYGFDCKAVCCLPAICFNQTIFKLLFKHTWLNATLKCVFAWHATARMTRTPLGICAHLSQSCFRVANLVQENASKGREGGIHIYFCGVETFEISMGVQWQLYL